MTRAPRLLATVGLAALLVSGCGTVRAGAAATVGDDRITTSALATVVARGLADPSAQQSVGADKPGYQREVLGRMIQHLIVARAAKDAGVSIDGADVDAAFDAFATQLGGEANLRAQALQAGISARDLRGAIADAALRDAIGDKLTASIEVPAEVLQQAYQRNIALFDRVHSAHILVKTQAQAEQLLAQVQADPASFPALVARYSLDTTNKDQGGDLGFQGRKALEKPFEDAIFGARPGSFVLAHTSRGFHVIHVIARRTVTLEQATTQLRRGLLGQQRSAAIVEVLTKTAKALHVKVNPRFGTFDAATEDVVALPLCPSTAVSSPSPRPDGNAAGPAPTASPAC